MVRDFLKELNFPFEVDSCQKCPFVEDAKCYGHKEGSSKYGKKLSKKVYHRWGAFGGMFVHKAGREDDCPLPVVVSATVKPK